MRKNRCFAVANMTVLAMMATLVPAASAGQAPQRRHQPTLRQINLAEYSQGGYQQYRTPALVASNKGTLLAAFNGMPNMSDLPSNITELVRRSANGGRTWKQAQVVRSAPKPKGFSDPSLLVDRKTGRIFLFYAAAVKHGFFGAKTGNNPSDPDILQTDYSYSDDDGRTWHSRRITPQIKEPSWGGIFAASGKGIQIRAGKYAGRLVQQYVIEIDGGEYAASAYSDDHGKTWRMGKLVGPGMNENKVVELADGALMLNVRATPHRLVAYSHDGGETWSKPKPDKQQRDPSDNGSIIRYAPNASASSPKAHWLLLSNNDDPSLRRNLTVKMSCDDGRTWPISRVVDPQSAEYSTLTRLPDDKIGLFYERDGYRYLTYASFGLDWLKGMCAPLEVFKPDEVNAGQRANLRVAVTNQTDHTIRHGTVSLALPRGWKTSRVHVPRLKAGARRTVTVPFTPSATTIGDQSVTARFEAAQKHSSLDTTLRVKPDAKAPMAPRVSGLLIPDGMSAGGAAGLLNDIASYAMRVTNTGNTTLTDITVFGKMSNLKKCHHAVLGPGQSYNCPYASHAITRANVKARIYRPKLIITATAPNGKPIHTIIHGESITIPQSSARPRR